MTNRVSLDGVTDSDRGPLGASEAVSEDSFRRVADMIETRTRELGSDIWSEPDLKLAGDAEEEREVAAAGMTLEDQEGIDDPVRELDEARRANGIPASRFRVLKFGESMHVTAR